MGFISRRFCGLLQLPGRDPDRRPGAASPELPMGGSLVDPTRCRMCPAAGHVRHPRSLWRSAALQSKARHVRPCRRLVSDSIVSDGLPQQAHACGAAASALGSGFLAPLGTCLKPHLRAPGPPARRPTATLRRAGPAGPPSRAVSTAAHAPPCGRETCWGSRWESTSNGCDSKPRVGNTEAEHAAVGAAPHENRSAAPSESSSAQVGIP